MFIPALISEKLLMRTSLCIPNYTDSIRQKWKSEGMNYHIKDIGCYDAMKSHIGELAVNTFVSCKINPIGNPVVE